MKVILATGIYPPEIGGIATYAHTLAQALREAGHTVHVVAYGQRTSDENITFISRQGGPWQRWWRYSDTLKEVSKDADVIYALSAMSVGAPVWLSGKVKPKKVLRLGGDVLWERYTDRGGMLSLREYYGSGSFLRWIAKRALQSILNGFDAVVFSTDFQKELYAKHYRIPSQTVIENALVPEWQPLPHVSHDPFRLLVFSRFVGFKNLSALIEAVAALPACVLTLVGDGPLRQELLSQAKQLGTRISFRPAVASPEKKAIFDTHDLLVVPSLTDISPNAALEARSAGLPVLLTKETGLRGVLTAGMHLQRLRTADEIAAAIRTAMADYGTMATEASMPVSPRSWSTVAQEHVRYFSSLLPPSRA